MQHVSVHQFPFFLAGHDTPDSKLSNPQMVSASESLVSAIPDLWYEGKQHCLVATCFLTITTTTTAGETLKKYFAEYYRRYTP